MISSMNSRCMYRKKLPLAPFSLSTMKEIIIFRKHQEVNTKNLTLTASSISSNACTLITNVSIATVTRKFRMPGPIFSRIENKLTGAVRSLLVKTPLVIVAFIRAFQLFQLFACLPIGFHLTEKLTSVSPGLELQEIYLFHFFRKSQPILDRVI